MHYRETISGFNRPGILFIRLYGVCLMDSCVGFSKPADGRKLLCIRSLLRLPLPHHLLVILPACHVRNGVLLRRIRVFGLVGHHEIVMLAGSALNPPLSLVPRLLYSGYPGLSPIRIHGRKSFRRTQEISKGTLLSFRLLMSLSETKNLKRSAAWHKSLRLLYGYSDFFKGEG